VLVGFVFADETGIKSRPALVISADKYHAGRQEVIIAAITSNVKRVLLGDHIVSQWQESGLLHPSVVTGVIRTVKQPMVQRRLGTMTVNDMQNVDTNLSTVLGLQQG